MGPMGAPYSNDLRRKFLQAYEKEKGTLEKLAAQFGVSVGWAKKVSARRTRSGEIDAPIWRHGPQSRVTAAVQEWLRKRIREQPDVTLQELQEQLMHAQALRLSIGRLWLALRQAGLKLKKSHSTPPSRTQPKRSSAGRRGGKR
jgi:transposase